MSYIKNKRDLFEPRCYELWDGCGLPHIQLTKDQGADNILIGRRCAIVEVKNSNKYKLTPAEKKMKRIIEEAGGIYWIVFDDDTALAVADYVREIAD